MTNNSPPLGYLINYGWLTPLDQSAMTNFHKYASPLVKNTSWDPGNKYTMAWQSGWTAIGYNGSVVKDPGDSVEILFDTKYSGKVGMMADPQELGSLGLLAIGVEPATSTESDWARAAKKLQQQKTDGIVRAYYDQDYINHLKNGDTVVSQAWSGDIFQADLNHSTSDLHLLIPHEGGMFWTDNMCIPAYAQNPKDAMTLMDYYYQPEIAGGRGVLQRLRLPGAGGPGGAAEPHRLGQADAEGDASIDRPAVLHHGPRATGVPDAQYIDELQELLQVQVPGRTDGVEQPVPADHPGRVTPEGVRRPRRVTRRRRARPGKVLAPYLLSLPAGLWLAGAVPGAAGRDAVAVAADLQLRHRRLRHDLALG